MFTAFAQPFFKRDDVAGLGDSARPVAPLSPPEPIDPIDPIDPIEPIEPIEPLAPQANADDSRRDVLDMLEAGMVSTDEALDLLEGIDQRGAGRGDSGDARRDRSGRDRAPRAARIRSRARKADVADNLAEASASSDLPRRSGRTLRIEVVEPSGSNVDLALPIGFLDTGLKVAERYAPGLFGGASGTAVRQAIGSGRTGTIIETTDASGGYVRIAIE